MKKNIVIQLRVDEKEKAFIKNQAEQCGLPVTRYLLQSAAKNPSKQVKLTQDIAVCLCGLNQLIHQIKDPVLQKELYQEVNPIWQLLK